MYKPVETTIEGMVKKEQTAVGTAIVYWFVTVSYMGLIFYISSRTWSYLPHLPVNADKFIHIWIYAVLGFLFYFSLRKSGIIRHVFLLACILSACYGLIDEFHQSYVPGREASFGDFIADSFGTIIGSFIAASLRVRR